MPEVAKAHHGNRLELVAAYLRDKEGLSRIKLAEEMSIKTSSLHYWYTKPVFSDTMWRKLTPVVEKYRLNISYLHGISNQMLINGNVPDEAWRLEMLDAIKEMVAIGKEILAALKKT